MPSREQVAFKVENDRRKMGLAAQLRQQEEAQRQQSGYAQQVGLMREQAALGAQAAQQQHGYASALSAQGAQQQQAAAFQNVDLQSRLHAVTLQQDEENRMQRLYKARAGVEDNPDLSPMERHMLLTQIESGLNPLENRQRETQMIQASVQTQALAQENDQRAVLFNQRQQRLNASPEQRMRMFTDPATGQQQLFYMNLEGEYHPLDFSQTQQMRQAQIEQMQAGTQATQQSTAQSGMLFPGQLAGQGLSLEHQRIANQQAQQNFNTSLQLAPHQVEAGRLANLHTVQQMMHADIQLPANLRLSYAHAADLEQRIRQASDLHPHNVNLARANVEIAGQNLLHLIDSNANADQVREAALALQESQRRHNNALTAATTQAADRAQGAPLPGTAFRTTLPNGDVVDGIHGHNGPVILSNTSMRITPQHIVTIQNQVRQQLAAERTAAMRDLDPSRRPAWVRDDNAYRQIYEQRVQHQVDLLRRHLRAHPEGQEGGGENRENRDAFDRDAGNALRP